jgi:hypothetical protein
LADFAADVGIVGDYLEVSILHVWLGCAGIRGRREGEKDVIGGCAGELSTVFNDGPLAGRVLEPSHRLRVHILKLDVREVVHGNFVGGELVPGEDALPALAVRLARFVKVLEGDIVDLCDTSVRTIRLNLVDGAGRGRRNVKRLASDVVAEEHEALLVRAMTGVVGGAVLRLSLAIDLGVAKLDDLIVTFTSSLQVDAKLGVDASDVMSSHFDSAVVRGYARLLSLVRLEVTQLIARPVIAAIDVVRVNVCTGALDRVRDVVFESGRSCVIAVVPWGNEAGELASGSDVVRDRYIGAGRGTIFFVRTHSNTRFFVQNHAQRIPVSWHDITDEVAIEGHISNFI